MLSREQLDAFQYMRARGGTLFSLLPRDLIPYMGMVSQMNFDPESTIARLLHHIVYGTSQDLKEIKKLLDANPSLVLQAGHVTTRSGLEVKVTTPLECAIAAGDPEIAAMIAPYFDRLDGGEAVRRNIYNRYLPIVKNILNPRINPPYDIKWLLEIIINTEDMADVDAEMNLDMTHQSLLHNAMEQFRTEYTTYSLSEKKVGMHSNYLDVIQALSDYLENFTRLGDEHHTKRSLVCRQIIGFMQRSDTSILRFRNARGYWGDLQRSLEFKSQPGMLLPDTVGDTSHLGLGYEYFAAKHPVRRAGAPGSTTDGRVSECRTIMDELIELMQPRRAEKSSRCVIC